MFKRKIEEVLNSYYKDPGSNIPIVEGARQVGKSFIVRATAKSFFPYYAEIDLKSDYEGEALFSKVRTTKDFYLVLSSILGDSLHEFGDTIVFLDEIQFYPHLLTMLKDLKSERRYRFIASGSLLGIALKQAFIPMGSADRLKMFPMDFEEFCWANGVGSDVIDYLKACFHGLSPVNDAIHARMLSLFKDYLVSGGLPDAVTAYVLERNVAGVRKVQTQIMDYYRADCSKYDDEHRLKIRRIYDSLVSYMTNKVKRIQYRDIEDKDGARSSGYEDEFDYLLSSGVALGSKAVANPVFPLALSSSKNLIKLYYNDVGLLTNLLYRNNVMAVLNQDAGINLGSVYETAAMMELSAHGHDAFYFDSKKAGEVDFMINDYESLSVLPVEIKSGKDQNNFRAIPKLVKEDGNYKLPLGYVFGNQNILKRQDRLIIAPIYLLMFL